MIQDADHQASAIVQIPAIRGVGQDTASITINNGPTTNLSTAPLSDLAAGTVTAPTTALYWGDGFRISTVVQNIGQAASPPFNVEFLLTGTNGLGGGQAISLGSALVAGGLASGYSQTITQDLTLPSRLPYGMTVGALSYGRIVAVVDPENLVNETYKNNNSAQSAPVTLRIFGVDGNATVPTTAPVRANAPLTAGTTTTKPTSPPPPPAINRKQAASRAKVLKLSEAQLIRAQLSLVKLQQAKGLAAKARAANSKLSAKLTSQVNNLSQIIKELL
jgi:hypothetical protein